MPIPKIAHRIWFGEPLPEKYYQYLHGLAELNPGYQTMLWSSPDTMSTAEYSKLQKFCDEHKITLRKIKEESDLGNYELIMQELQSAKRHEKYKKIHFVRASDIARIAILNKFGGIYTDTDLEMKESFPTLTAKQDILLMLNGLECINSSLANFS